VRLRSIAFAVLLALPACFWQRIYQSPPGEEVRALAADAGAAVEFQIQVQAEPCLRRAPDLRPPVGGDARNDPPACVERAPRDWYPVELALRDQDSRLVGNLAEERDELAALLSAALAPDGPVSYRRAGRWAQWDGNAAPAADLLVLRVYSFKNEPSASALLSCLTLFVFPGTIAEYFETEALYVDGSGRQLRVAMEPPVRETTVSWFLFGWGFAISDPPERLHSETVNAAAIGLARSRIRTQPGQPQPFF
jgi:hypothetical protein